jgi:hypothetical protein
VFDDNHTWSRSAEPGTADEWGRSVQPGGTPGEQNLIRLRPDANRLNVVIEPQIISPDGDGVDDGASIIIEAPSARGYTLKIYDKHGRVVKTFEDDSQDLPDGYLYFWDGRADSGNRLPIGIYILYIEAGGVESIKKTIVVAR